MSADFAIVGVGQLGSRHLQSLASFRRAGRIFIVDPSDESLQRARERYEAVRQPDAAPQELVALTDIAGLPKEIEFIVLANSADTRLAAIEAVAAQSTVKNWLLEKVLFQRVADYDKARAVFGANAGRVWVNCAQRYWDFFREIKQRFPASPDAELLVVGGEWGLGSNAVHNADVAAYLWGDKLTHRAELDAEALPSKRPGFFEFTGLMETRAAGGGTVRQRSYRGSDAPFSFIFTHPQGRIAWDVAKGEVIESSAQTGWAWQTRTMGAAYQSQLTARVAGEVLDSGACDLPLYDEAARVHVGVIQALFDGAARAGIKLGDVCPIT
jgi:hypothetical protein